MVYTYPNFNTFPRAGYNLNQHKTGYSLNGFNFDVEIFSARVVSASVLPPVAESPTPVHSDSVDYNIIPLKLSLMP